MHMVDDIKNTILIGDCLEVLKDIPDCSVNCCVTSPPYYNLRDYGIENQIGLEESPEEYVEKLRCVFDEVNRVLTNDGTLWLNIGDSYQSTRIYLKDQIESGKELTNLHTRDYQKYPDKRPNFKGGQYKIKRKDVFGIPWRVAFALQEYGWFLRSDIIWNKTNPMPENVHDRPSKSHEYIFLFSKRQHYYFDEDRIREKSGAKCRSVWSVAVDNGGIGHYAPFPEQLINRCILAGCPENGIVLDPFIGSGTTGAVCLKNDRNFIGIEINPEFASVAQKRLGPMLHQTRLNV